VITKSNLNNPTIGDVMGVHVWQMPTHQDVRGRLFKAYSSADTELFPIPFDTYEHFFTESKKDVFRGMHFQGNPHAVSKIISVVLGRAKDFLFDMREDSETYGNLQIVDLDDSTPASIFIPTGVAHGYLALAEKTIISYRMDGPFCGNCDGGFSGGMVASHLPALLSETIRSIRDAELVEFGEYQFKSECEK
jgi:dTDP-4-dehydrorhamnose 3,5-epimerase-like enzyme